jgi:hypothetical protein
VALSHLDCLNVVQQISRVGSYPSKIFTSSLVKSEEDTYGPVESIISEMGGRNLLIREGLVCLLVILFLVLPIPSFSQTAIPPGLGSIEGVVLDDAGKPISGATVYGLPEQDMRKGIFATSDTAGKFTLQDVPTGNAYLHAFKESEGYPNNFYAFYYVKTAHSPVKVEIKPGEATDITIQLGPKAAYLQVDATDEKGMPVPVGYQLDRDDVRGPFITDVSTDPRLVGGGFINGVMLVPPVPFRLTVFADGYEPWHYGGAKWQGKRGLITLKSGHTLSLRVQLRHSR